METNQISCAHDNMILCEIYPYLVGCAFSLPRKDTENLILCTRIYLVDSCITDIVNYT